MEKLLEISESLIREVPVGFKRYLYSKINWNNRLIGVKGARGVGKTTMLLQWLKSVKKPYTEIAYLSLDDIYFTTHSLVDTARSFFQQGGKVLVLDEVHKYASWAREIKNLYDRYPDLQIIFTGSSIIDISKQEADISRRAVMYELSGLSFREYLELHYHLSLPVIQLEEILSPESSLRDEFSSDFKPLAYLKEYLQYGYYPFFTEGKENYFQRIKQLVRTVIESDMAELKGFDIRHAKKMLQLMYIISQAVPFKPNINDLSRKSQIHRNTILNYIHFLHEARLVDLLFPSTKGVAALQKPEKIYLNNTNLLYALSEQAPSTGTIREVFFNNQLTVFHKIAYSTRTDFEINNKYHFEVGGKNKTKKQIQGLENAWIVKDDMEFPASGTLPLWMFGFLY